jgi:hypothetical protein
MEPFLTKVLTYLVFVSLFLYQYRIARKRGVFKVETIGDSYVAVTGKSNRVDQIRFKSFAPNRLPSVHLSHHCHYYISFHRTS